MTAHVVDKLPEGDDWMYEVKFDESRTLLMKDAESSTERSSLLTRRVGRRFRHYSIDPRIRSGDPSAVGALEHELFPSVPKLSNSSEAGGPRKS